MIYILVVKLLETGTETAIKAVKLVRLKTRRKIFNVMSLIWIAKLLFEICEIHFTCEMLFFFTCTFYVYKQNGKLSV